MVDFIHEPARDTPVKTRCDVLVVGGGTAGVAAAVAAARQGADVVLAERFNYPGGLATGGLIVLLLVLDDGQGRQVTAGLCQEAIDRLAARNQAFMPPKSEWGNPDNALVAKYQAYGLISGHGPHNVRGAVAYNAEELKFVLERMIADSGVRLMYSALATEAIRDGDRLNGAIFQGKEGRFAVLADVVIDTSGDGDIFASAGCANETEEVAPWLWFTMGGVSDVTAARAAGARAMHGLGPGEVLMPWGATERVARKISGLKTEDITYASTECRRLIMEEVDRLRAEVPAFKYAYLGHVADQVDLTESRRLVGEYVLAREDVDQPFDDTIAVAGHWTKYEAIYNIPYRSLIPRELANALVAGRCLSVDHRTHHATKEIPPCFATGEAAGIAASLALESGGNVRTVEMERLQAKLEAAGAILFPYGRGALPPWVKPAG